MLPMILWSTAAHFGEGADPTLLDWIKDWFDHTLQLGPWTVITALGLLIVAIPLSITLLYAIQQWRTGSRGG